jgi:hypothetical protein
VHSFVLSTRGAIEADAEDLREAVEVLEVLLSLARVLNKVELLEQLSDLGERPGRTEDPDTDGVAELEVVAAGVRAESLQASQRMNVCVVWTVRMKEQSGLVHRAEGWE